MTATSAVGVDGTLDLEGTWPDLFDGLTVEQRETVTEVCANDWLEGWDPTRDDVADLVALTTGQIDGAEYIARGAARAEASRLARGEA